MATHCRPLRRINNARPDHGRPERWSGRGAGAGARLCGRLERAPGAAGACRPDHGAAPVISRPAGIGAPRLAFGRWIGSGGAAANTSGAAARPFLAHSGAIERRRPFSGARGDIMEHARPLICEKGDKRSLTARIKEIGCKFQISGKILKKSGAKILAQNFEKNEKSRFFWRQQKENRNKFQIFVMCAQLTSENSCDKSNSLTGNHASGDLHETFNQTLDDACDGPRSC